MPSLLTHVDAARRLACNGAAVADIMAGLDAHEITARQAIRWARGLSKSERCFYAKECPAAGAGTVGPDTTADEQDVSGPTLIKEIQR